MPPRAEAVAAGSSVGAAILALAALVISAYSLSLAHRAEERSNRQELQQYASKILLREANAIEYQRLDKSKGLTWVVVNYSGAQAEQVWVRDGSGNYYRIQGLEPCSYYAFGPGFVPSDLYFVDAVGRRWHREYGKEPVTDGFVPMPGPNANKATNGVLSNCTG